MNFDGRPFHLTEHAVDRYQERVRPALSPEAAKADLLRLIAACGRQGTPPEWAISNEYVTDWFLFIGDDVCLPIHKGSAVTCLTRGGLPELTRARRNERKQAQRRARRLRRMYGPRPDGLAA